jgi:hypothetical protein
VLRGNIVTAAVAFVLLIGGSGLSLAAETGGAPSGGKNGVAGFPTAKDSSTSSAHNPKSSERDQMEHRATEIGSDTSTHNPAGKKD